MHQQQQQTSAGAAAIDQRPRLASGVTRRGMGKRRALPGTAGEGHKTASLNMFYQSINVKFVGRHYTTRPGAPTVSTIINKVHS